MLLVLLQANMFKKFSSQRINKDRNTIKFDSHIKTKAEIHENQKGVMLQNQHWCVYVFLFESWLNNKASNLNYKTYSVLIRTLTSVLCA